MSFIFSVFPVNKIFDLFGNGKETRVYAQRIKQLEQEFNSASQNRINYSLLSQIEGVYRELNTSNQENRAHRSFFQKIFYYLKPSNKDKIASLFTRALKQHGLSKEELGSFSSRVDAAAKKGDLELLKFLLSQGRELSQRELNFAALSASTNNHLDCLEFLLSQGRTINGTCIEIAVKEAAQEGNSEKLDLLLRNGREISMDHLGAALIYAAEKGHHRCLTILLSGGREVSSYHLGAAAKDAAIKGHEECLKFLLGNPFTIKRSDRENVLGNCAAHGFVECIRGVLGKGPIGILARDFAIDRASGPNKDEMIEILNNCEVEDDSSSNIPLKGIWQIHSLSDVALNPLTYLNRIVKEGFPIRLTLSKSSTVDLGGVTKQFVSILLSSLIPHFHLDSKSFPAPQLENKKELFQKLGDLFSKLAEKNESRTDKLLIGEVFNKKFYQILKHAHEKGKGEELNCSVAEILKDLDENHKMAARVILYPENQTFKQEFADVYDCQIEEVPTIAKEVIEPYSNAALWMLEGADETLKSLISSSSAEALCLMFQGEEAAIEAIQAAITLDGPTELLEQQKNWIFEILDESDLDWRKKFLTFVTARNTLTPGTQIKFITRLEDGPSFEPSTCSNLLGLPNMHFSSKADFKAVLDFSMEYMGFNIR